MHTRQHFFLVYFYGHAVSSVFKRFLRNTWFSLLVLFKYIRLVCSKYFEVKLRNQVKFRLDRKLFVPVRGNLKDASANNSLLQWKVETKLCLYAVLRFSNIPLFYKMP